MRLAYTQQSKNDLLEISLYIAQHSSANDSCRQSHIHSPPETPAYIWQTTTYIGLTKL